MNAIETLASEWRASGVVPGSMLLLHSSLKRLLWRMKTAGFAPDPETVLDSFLEALGPDGTLLLPLFNFDFTNYGTPFDIRSTPSHMGSLTEAARLRSGVVRTGHPVYSFAALGAKAKLFEGVDNVSAYGEDSPFGILRRENGYVACLDLSDQSSMTFYHHVEEMCSVPYRYMKQFSGLYTDANGETISKVYCLYVRDIKAGVTTCLDNMAARLWQLGLYAGDKPEIGTGLRVISAVAMFDAVKTVINNGEAEGMLYRIEH